MKLNEEMFEKMREATKKLLTSGPAAATVAIQQALQKGGSPEHAMPHPGWNAPRSRPMRDITPSPGTETIDVVDVAETVAADGFVGDLLTRLRIPARHTSSAIWFASIFPVRVFDAILCAAA